MLLQPRGVLGLDESCVTLPLEYMRKHVDVASAGIETRDQSSLRCEVL